MAASPSLSSPDFFETPIRLYVPGDIIHIIAVYLLNQPILSDFRLFLPDVQILYSNIKMTFKAQENGFHFPYHITVIL